MTYLLEKSWVKWLLIIGALHFLVILEITKLFLWQTPLDMDHLFKTYINLLISWILYGFFLPPMVYILNRYSFGKEDWKKSAIVLTLAGTCFFLLHPFLYQVIDLFMRKWSDPTYSYMYRYFTRNNMPLPGFLEIWWFDVKQSFHLLFWIYGSTVGVLYSINYYRMLRKSELDRAQLEMGLTKARLQLLTSQLQPHFLFNTLNSISELMHQNVEDADQMIARLSDLLRLVLEENNLPFIPLHKELKCLELYLEIEKVRFKDKMHVHLKVDPAVHSVLVPFLFIQPFVENAIRHGISKTSRKAGLEIHVQQSNGELLLEIANDGPFIENQPFTEGVGLQNIRNRLSHLYQGRFHLETIPLKSGGMKVLIRLPKITHLEIDPNPILGEGNL